MKEKTVAKLRIEIMRFKPSGKWYETFVHEVINKESYAIISEIEAYKQEKEPEIEWIWLITGKGMPFEVPHLVR